MVNVVQDKNGQLWVIDEHNCYVLYQPVFGSINQIVQVDFDGLTASKEEFEVAFQKFLAVVSITGQVISIEPTEIIIRLEEDDDIYDQSVDPKWFAIQPQFGERVNFKVFIEKIPSIEIPAYQPKDRRSTVTGDIRF